MTEYFLRLPKEVLQEVSDAATAELGPGEEQDFPQEDYLVAKGLSGSPMRVA